MGIILYEKLSFDVVRICFSVHNKLGRYCNELQYADALEHMLQHNNILYEREKIIPISFVGEKHGRNKIDFLIEDTIILEIKAKRIITKEDYFQTRRYLSALNKKLALLINFRSQYIHPKRILNSLANP